ncbi:MAG: Spy/CpxP family protein refolding chaperone [Candidatus Aminicenantes bacterium]|nr:Spy/CpxP family protein refolding chaperone [Candidatus Aminicenantes bacterium]
MSKSRLVLAVILVITLAVAYPVLAQQAESDCCKAGGCKEGTACSMPGCGIPNLTTEQLSKIQKLKLEFEKEMLPVRTKMQSLKLDLRTLNAENADLKKIEAKIDEISKICAELQKKRIAHHRDIRNLLTDEQKAFFDLRCAGMGCQSGGCGGGCKSHRMGRMEHGCQSGCGQGKMQCKCKDMKK